MENPFAHASELTSSTWQAALTDPATLAFDLETLTNSVETLSTALIDAAGNDESGYMSSEFFHPRFMESLAAALEQGTTIAAKAVARDLFMMASPWPFNPGSIHRPVRVVHGAHDRLVFLHHQDALTTRFTGGITEVVDGGHYTTMPALWLKGTDDSNRER
jgi:pimeloyl-ACP methyl ester carboxylesterase